MHGVPLGDPRSGRRSAEVGRHRAVDTVGLASAHVAHLVAAHLVLRPVEVVGGALDRASLHPHELVVVGHVHVPEHGRLGEALALHASVPGGHDAAGAHGVAALAAHAVLRFGGLVEDLGHRRLLDFVQDAGQVLFRALHARHAVVRDEAHHWGHVDLCRELLRRKLQATLHGAVIARGLQNLRGVLNRNVLLVRVKLRLRAVEVDHGDDVQGVVVRVQRGAGEAGGRERSVGVVVLSAHAKRDRGCRVVLGHR
mmetsp:Transcript_12285/g.28150  ORF Transcript_12285/g.28150 Transcript_12285/m.28150 type:complete len:254 (-) Transcript_12285:351-1112(-)